MFLELIPRILIRNKDESKAEASLLRNISTFFHTRLVKTKSQRDKPKIVINSDFVMSF